MTIRDLEYFTIVAKHGKFSAASEICHVSQPTVSGQLKKLEEELGQDLFERNTRRVGLSSFGREILPLAEEILSGVKEIERKARESQDPFKGSVRVGIFPTLGPWLIPQIIGQLRSDFPELMFYIVEEQTDVLLERLDRSELDAVILALPLRDTHLHAIPLFREDFLAAVPAGHPWSDRPSIESKELKGEELLLLNEGHCFRDQALELCRNHGAEENSAFRATSIETLRQMVRLGTGITLIPRLAVPDKPEEDIAYLPINSPSFVRRIALCSRPSHSRLSLWEDMACTIRQCCGEILKAKACS